MEKIRGNMVVAIGGITRAGKSTLAKRLVKKYGCTYLQNDFYFVSGAIEDNKQILPNPFSHWESAISCGIEDLYNDLLKKIMSSANQSKMVVVEGHLLYYRQDIVNLIDIKIMLKMSYEGACKRVKLLRPRLIKNDAWFKRIMWDQFNAQNALFNKEDPNSYELSGEDPEEEVFNKTVQIIEAFKKTRTTNPYLKSLLAIPTSSTDKCSICLKSSNNCYQHLCGHWFDKTCFYSLFTKFFKSVLETRKGQFQCPSCGKDFTEEFIQKVGDLHSYRKVLYSDDSCYICKNCGRIHWTSKERNIIKYPCTKCVYINNVE